MKIRIKFTFSDPTGVKLDDTEGMTITDETLLLDLLDLFFGIAKEYMDRGYVVSKIVWDEDEPKSSEISYHDVVNTKKKLQEEGIKPMYIVWGGEQAVEEFKSLLKEHENVAV